MFLFFHLYTCVRVDTTTFTAMDPQPRCASSLWVGKQKYAWIDLTAGPNRFGPQTSGDGLVMETSLPRLSWLLNGKGARKFLKI